MSVDDTNALRAKLGLAPLRRGPAREIRDGAKEREEKRRVAETADLKAKVEARKRQREVDARNALTAKLGDEDDARGDDARAWLAKSRGSMANKAKDLERQKAAKMAAMFAARDEDAEASEDEGDAGEGKTEYTSKDLRGLRVRHDAEEIVEGQEVVLTLKDASVLDDGEDELENVLMAERKSRKKARLAATKRTGADDPFGEKADEEKKTLLAKYDDKAEGDGMELDGDGRLDAAEERRKADIKARLAAEAAGLRGKLDTAEVVKGEQADFHTREEMQAKFVKREKKKKMRKKLRKKHVDAAELEGDALAPESRDHGSRRSRGKRGVEDEGATNEKDSKFANALQKAREVTDKKILAELAGDVEEEEEDDELARALARSRNMANKAARSAPEDVVAQVTARRAADAAKAEAAAPASADESLVFTDMSEFVQGINARGDDEDDDAEADEMPDAPPSPPPPPPMGDDEEMPDVPPPPPPGAEDAAAEDDAAAAAASEAPALAEKHIVKQGLASTLALLKEKAQLDDANSTRWSGRTNDLKDRFDKQHVLEAHAAEDAVVDGYKFGFKLDRFDEFGRKLTPKQAFRELCHRFHGIEPGKMKREKRLRQYQEEQQRLAASSAVDERVKNVQREHATPYVVLSGNVHAGQSKRADPLATAQRERLATERASAAAVDPAAVAASNASKVSFAMRTNKK